MSGRERLPDARLTETFDLVFAGQDFTCGTGRFGDGRLAEIFLAPVKRGSALDDLCRDLSVLASLALQHGVAAAVIGAALCRDGAGAPAGPLGAAFDLAEGAA